MAPSLQKTVLITGCNPGGIGHSLAKSFHSHGLRVFATARDPSVLTSLNDIGITTLPLEVTNASSITTLYETISSLTAGAGLDYLVNNAGKNYTVPALDINVDEAREMFDVNLFGVMRICSTFAPLLIAARGTIVQIGSVAGTMPYVFGSAYNASKAALHSYTDTLRVELRPFGVDVVTIVTGGVRSRIARTVRELDEDSLYTPVREEYMRRQQHSQEVGMPNEKYAESVVRQVLKGRGRREIWEGGGSWLVWFVRLLLPRWVMVGFIMFRSEENNRLLTADRIPCSPACSSSGNSMALGQRRRGTERVHLGLQSIILRRDDTK